MSMTHLNAVICWRFFVYNLLVNSRRHATLYCRVLQNRRKLARGAIHPLVIRSNCANVDFAEIKASSRGRKKDSKSFVTVRVAFRQSPLTRHFYYRAWTSSVTFYCRLKAHTFRVYAKIYIYIYNRCALVSSCAAVFVYLLCKTNVVTNVTHFI